MKNTRFAFVLCALFVISSKVIAQKQKVENPEKDIKKVINRFFEGMEKGDTALLKSVCMNGIVLQTYMADKDGKMQIYTEDFSEFLALISTQTGDKYDERIKFESINVEKSLASAWTPYTFYLNDKRSHCGTNSFQLVKAPGGWKIQYIIDTRRKQGCD